ncbi:SapC family protein [Aidingimonas halophila]|uniref:SapC protein n=1 Tax=Aidingimonas halophila TaxID=574349 RepID=A0A1H3CZ87_9GAMM|nr:SapC family protein [Aidingimonas halophila]GHC30794.1 peptidase [Aidingimonas halophila]SDX59340.1 SapC protein [Aidingimonas halophila]
MATQLLIYRNVQPITRDKHGDLSLKVGKDFAFAREVNSVPLMAAEFPAAASDLPIVFTDADDGVLPVAVLGIERDANLMVDDDNRWRGEYVPAFFRRYPFVFASSSDGKTFTLCIDEEYEGFNREGRGEHLFDADGEQTQYLGRVLSFLQDYQAHFQRTRAFCRRLVEMDLLESVEAQVRLPEGGRRTLTGFKAINRNKLKELSAEQLQTLMGNDELELMHIHLQSMRNFNRLTRLARGGDAVDAQSKTDPTAEERSPDDAATPSESAAGTDQEANTSLH